MKKIRNFLKYSFLSITVFLKFCILICAVIVKKIIGFATGKARRKEKSEILKTMETISSNLYGIGAVLENTNEVLSKMTMIFPEDFESEEEFLEWSNSIENDSIQHCSASKPKMNYSSSLIFKNKKKNPDYNNEWEPFIGKNSHN